MKYYIESLFQDYYVLDVPNLYWSDAFEIQPGLLNSNPGLFTRNAVEIRKWTETSAKGKIVLIERNDKIWFEYKDDAMMFKELEEARAAFVFLKPKLITVEITYQAEDIEKIRSWLSQQTVDFWLTTHEYETLDWTFITDKDTSEPSMGDILASIRRIISEEHEQKIKIHFVNKGDAIKFKLMWHKK
jgi:hypothetical protein